MAPLGITLSLLSLCLAVSAAAAASSPTAAPAAKTPVAATVHDACQHTTVHYDLCVTALSSDPAAGKASLLGLANIAIGVVQQNASATGTYLARIYDDEKLESTPELQQCLEDCEEKYEDAVEQLTDALAALDSGAYSEAHALVAASQAEVKLCQRGCQATPQTKNVLTGRNRDVDRLCSIALTLTKMLRRNHN